MSLTHTINREKLPQKISRSIDEGDFAAGVGIRRGTQTADQLEDVVQTLVDVVCGKFLLSCARALSLSLCLMQGYRITGFRSDKMQPRFDHTDNE